MSRGGGQFVPPPITDKLKSLARYLLDKGTKLLANPATIKIIIIFNLYFLRGNTNKKLIMYIPVRFG